MKNDAASSEVMDRRVAQRAVPFRVVNDSGTGAVHDLLIAVHRPELRAAVAERVVLALEAGETRYTARTGIAPLREAIARLSSEQGFPATAETTVVTNGGTEARFISLQTLVSRGSAVRMVEPVEPDAVKLVEFLGGSSDRVAAADVGDLSGVDVLLLPLASGIDGSLLERDQVAGILEAAAVAGCTVILDRSASPDCYVEQPAFDRPDLVAGALTIGSFSGAYGLAGWRAGYFTAPSNLMPRLAGLKESMSISTTTPTQFAMLATIEHLAGVVTGFREHARARLSMVSGLLERAGLAFRSPDVFPGVLIDVRQSGLDDAAFAERLLHRHGARVEAASRYGESLAGYARIDVRAADAALQAGINAISAELSEEAG